MPISKNSVSLAGEFAVLSQLSLRGYDANMTLGNTKGVDILISNPESGKMFKLEVKTNFRSTRSVGGSSALFGKFISSWIMSEKHESISDPNLFYCFVNISEDTQKFRFFIVPNNVVSKYVKEQHVLWLSDGQRTTITTMRQFRMGIQGEKYPIETPIAEKYENNWGFKK